MFFHDENVKKDNRTRFYLPIQRILKSDNVLNSEQLLKNKEIQFYVHYTPTVTIINPNGELIIDFGKSLHGGIRINSLNTDESK